MTHTCHALHCTVEVEPKYFMCRKHWFMLPAEMRAAIWKVYSRGQEVDKLPSTAYLEVAKTCISFVNTKEREIQKNMAEEKVLISELNRLEEESGNFR